MTTFIKFVGLKQATAFQLNQVHFLIIDTAITKFEIETRSENFRFFTKNNEC